MDVVTLQRCYAAEHGIRESNWLSRSPYPPFRFSSFPLVRPGLCLVQPAPISTPAFPPRGLLITLMMEAENSSETSVRVYQTTRCNIPVFSLNSLCVEYTTVDDVSFYLSSSSALGCRVSYLHITYNWKWGMPCGLHEMCQSSHHHRNALYHELRIHHCGIACLLSWYTCRKISPSFVDRYKYTHVWGQPAEVRGEAIAYEASCQFHLSFPSNCDVAQARRYFASSIPRC
jgi:hypothetical protein